jgi:hypothetical protein
LNRVCVYLRRNASLRMTSTLKIKFSKTAALAAGASSLRRGIIADSTPDFFDGLFSSSNCQLPWLSLFARGRSSAFKAVRTLRSVFQIRFSNSELRGFGFLVNRWNDRDLRRNYFALGYIESGVAEVSRPHSSEKGHIVGRLDNVIGSRLVNQQTASSATGLPVVGAANPSLPNSGSQKNQIHAIRLFESLSGSPIDRQQRMNSNEKNNAYQCVAIRGKSDCDC